MIYTDNNLQALHNREYLEKFVILKANTFPMATPRKLWSRNEFILALNLYYKLPFGKLNTRTKEVQKLAVLINSVAIRLTNFAACDPYIINSGRKGMSVGKDQYQP